MMSLLPEAGEAAGVAPPAQRAREPRRRSGGRMPLAWHRTSPEPPVAPNFRVLGVSTSWVLACVCTPGPLALVRYRPPTPRQP